MENRIYDEKNGLWYGNVDPLNGGIFKSPEMEMSINVQSKNTQNLILLLTGLQSL